MRVVVIGATGNIGTSTVRALAADPGVESVLGLARRPASLPVDKAEWATADVRETDLVPLLRGADAVVHLAWLFQPTHDPVVTWRNNVLGSERVFDAVARAGVPALVYSSSVGAYSPVPPADKGAPVTEDWPTHARPTAAYGREKAYVERLLDVFERDHPDRRVVRMRPGFVFQRSAASGQRRLFAGPLLPNPLVRPGLLPVVPDIPGLRFQVLHARDAGEAFRLAVTRDVRGAFNLGADPVIGVPELARLLDARPVPVPARAARAALGAAWRLRLVPASPGLLDLALHVPVMDVARARGELGWSPRHSAFEALEDFLSGLREGAGADTPPLSPRTSGPARLRELLTGVGRRP
ncbi:NAD-dependent epimerase/dehydratase family protein [Actinomadura parmotrematis]|uniref:NAD-dependent epimerase/dehydratase family protein n=1 Tax=Actinomadura parmotrematis TaxID=2864039 RepID=A0ABS7FL63_9ACTN|nr:NAD-dependent epimerase/dehydratase family protein [Actinomadura parmotrematis]MBW8481117.1 NAD-dependent epimerase/dehydratase family protein [Actinomadura parmotrematis]